MKKLIKTNVQSNPLNFTDPFGLKEKGARASRFFAPHERKITKEECEAEGCTYENGKCYCPDEHGNWVEVSSVEEAKEIKKKREDSAKILALQAYLYVKTFYNYSGSLNDLITLYSKNFFIFLATYNEWFKNPQLALGQQSGAKYWGPIGNMLYLFTGGEKGSSCAAWAIGLLNALEILNNESMRATLHQKWFPLVHTDVAIQIKEPRIGKWVTTQFFYPFWRLW